MINFKLWMLYEMMLIKMAFISYIYILKVWMVQLYNVFCHYNLFGKGCECKSRWGGAIHGPWVMDIGGFIIIACLLFWVRLYFLISLLEQFQFTENLGGRWRDFLQKLCPQTYIIYLFSCIFAILQNIKFNKEILVSKM